MEEAEVAGVVRVVDDDDAFERWASGKTMPANYFKFRPSKEAEDLVKAVGLGLEIKDLFIEAGRRPARQTSPRIWDDTGWSGASISVTVPPYARPAPVEFARPVRWRRGL